MTWFEKSCRHVLIKALQCGPVPAHVGFIMDGNRRYGRKVKVGNGQGYYLGYDTLQEMLAVCMELGIKVVTVYAFSIENFKRPPDQVETLMELAKTKLTELCEQSELVSQYGIGIRVLGDDRYLPEDVRKVVHRAVELTKTNNRAILNMCFPYTSREELAMATRSLVRGIEERDLDPSDLTTKALEDSLYTRSCPPMDILIRTSGEIRLSDFMLWQCSRACHVEFIDCYWPEFTFWKLVPILLRFQLEAGNLAEQRATQNQSLDTTVSRTRKAMARSLRSTSVPPSLSSSSSSSSLSNLSLPYPESPLDSISNEDSRAKQEQEELLGQFSSERSTERVASFLAHRGHIPTCPIVHLQ